MILRIQQEAQAEEKFHNERYLNLKAYREEQERLEAIELARKAAAEA